MDEEMATQPGVCRVCHTDPEEPDRLISLCACTGNREFIHVTCLLRRLVRPNDSQTVGNSSDGDTDNTAAAAPIIRAIVCPYCHHAYKVDAMGSKTAVLPQYSVAVSAFDVFAVVRTGIAWNSYSPPSYAALVVNGVLYFGREQAICTGFGLVATALSDNGRAKSLSRRTSNALIFAYFLCAVISQTLPHTAVGAALAWIPWSVDMVRDATLFGSALAVTCSSSASLAAHIMIWFKSTESVLRSRWVYGLASASTDVATTDYAGA